MKKVEVRNFEFFDEAEVEPCPFCGGYELRFDSYLVECWVECCYCDSRGPAYILGQVVSGRCEGTALDSERNALDLWNKRAKGEGIEL